MHHRRIKEPNAAEYHLCWEPTLEEGRSLLLTLTNLNLESTEIASFVEELSNQVVDAEEELDEAIARHKKRTEQATTRLVNEEQLQEAVKFLTSVWKGEQEATLSQVAAARCFMRSGEDY
jgi:hypothetical protein